MNRQTLYFCLLLSTLTIGWVGLTSFNSFREEYGKAGYYSDALQGRKTASGEKYDKKGLTCAHKSLPFGSLIRVTRLDTKESVVVRVNDRGPYRDGYIVDLSRRAAEELDLIKAGTTKVKIDVIEKPTDAIGSAADLPAASRAGRTPTASATTDARPIQYSTPSTNPAPTSLTPKTGAATRASATKTGTSANEATRPGATGTELYQLDLRVPTKQGFGVQVTTLYNAPNVFPEVTKLMKYWPGRVLVIMQPMPEATENTIYKLILGPVVDRANAEKLRREAVKRGYPKCFVVDLSQL